jgi:aminoglycoside N3'-acetyltransferase
MPDRPLSELIFDLTSTEVDRDMGALSAAVVSHPERRRGNHPVCSFSALGPLADELVRCQQPRSVWAPLERLLWLDGAVALLGVDLTRLSLIHLAEQHAGRRPFVRWARGGKGEVVRVDVGGCSDGFGSFEPVLADVALTEQVGESRWMVVHAGQALRLLTRAIEESPGITRCLDPACERCGDAVAGGPIL